MLNAPLDSQTSWSFFFFPFLFLQCCQTQSECVAIFLCICMYVFSLSLRFPKKETFTITGAFTVELSGLPPPLCHWNHVCAGFILNQTQEQVISLISSSPLTDGVLVSEFKPSSVCYKHTALSFYHTYPQLTFNFVSQCLPVLPWVYLFLTRPCPCKCCRPHTPTVLSFLLALAVPRAEVCSLSPYVNNTWPLRFWMWGENKIPGLGCFSVCSPPGTLTLTLSGLLLRGILSDILQHTVIGSSPEYIQEHIYLCTMCAGVWDQNAK